MKKTNLFIANWKMNGSRGDVAKFIDGLEKLITNSQAEIVLCPPFPLLSEYSSRRKKSKVKLGAQDCHYAKNGAYTGDVSADLLASFESSYVIIGHSERRTMHNEHSEIINKKVSAASAAGLTPILCVGETYNQRESNQVREVISNQVRAALASESKCEHIVIAYEPVWSIGTGKTPTVKEIAEVCTIVKESLSYLGIETGKKKIHILYGGSVSDDNVAELSKVEGLSGFLVGSASLDVKKFANIINAKQG